MALFKHSHDQLDEDVDALDGAGYDVQTDLAAATQESTSGAGLNPFAGEVDAEPVGPGYDIDRDIAT